MRLPEVATYGSVDSLQKSTELTAANLSTINEYLTSNSEHFLERQKAIVNRPLHYLFDSSERDKAEKYIEDRRGSGWLVAETSLNQDMFATHALGSIVECDALRIDLTEAENRRSFSTTLVSAGIQRQRDMLVVLRNLHQLDRDERSEFFERLVSADEKSLGGFREKEGAQHIQFVGIGDTLQLQRILDGELFHRSGEQQVEYNEEIAKTTLRHLQGAFEQLEKTDSALIKSPRKSGKSTALTALRQQFPEELYIVKLDRLISTPEEALRKRWVTREGQIAVFDRSEVLQDNQQAKEFLVNTFKKVIFLESSDDVEEHPTFFSV